MSEYLCDRCRRHRLVCCGRAEKESSISRFAKYLRRAIDSDGRTHSEIAKSVGIHTVTLSNYASGKHVPRAVTIYKLSATLRDMGLVESIQLLVYDERSRGDDNA